MHEFGSRCKVDLRLVAAVGRRREENEESSEQ